MTVPPTELEPLRREIARTRAALAACVAGALALVLSGMSNAAPVEGDVLRVRGLIVEDAEGRARVLIGAPVPHAAERVRTDREKVVAAWSERYGGNLDWYFQDVNNDAFGMLVLDENGHDRIVIGSPTPDPMSGARIEPSHGIQFNDEEGVEVGGMGYFEERRMTGLGLDNPKGEGLYLLAAENGTSGVIVKDHDEGRRLFLGLAQQGSGLGPGDAKHLGGSIVDAKGAWWVLGPDAGFAPTQSPEEDGTAGEER